MPTEMTNQAAQTMPELPAPCKQPFYFCNKCGHMGDSGPSHTREDGELCDYSAVGGDSYFTSDQMHQYARDYAAALSQPAGVTEDNNIEILEAYAQGVNDGRAGMHGPTAMDGKAIVEIDPLEDCVADACSFLASDAGWARYGRHREDHEKRYRALLAAAPAASGGEPPSGASVSERARDERFTAMLIGIIVDVQDALGFTDEDKECSNGSLEIVDAINELRKEASRYRWIRDRIAGKEHVAELVEYNHDAHPELRDEVDAAIDSAMQQHALSSPRQEGEAVATLQICPPNSDGTSAYFMDRVRDTGAFSKLAPGTYSLYTHPSTAASAQGLTDADYFQWLATFPNIYTAADLLKAGQYVTLRRLCKSLVSLDLTSPTTGADGGNDER